MTSETRNSHTIRVLEVENMVHSAIFTSIPTPSSQPSPGMRTLYKEIPSELEMNNCWRLLQLAIPT